MARLFPLRSEAPTGEGTPRVVDLADEDADAVFGALSSTTAREIYATLDAEPGTPSDIADAIDSSIQNVRYHLEKLEDAGLVEVVDTWYSSRGNEMSVYATADGPLIVTSDRSTGDKLKTAISRFVGGVGALAGASLLVQFGLERFLAPSPADDAAYAQDEDGIATDSPDEDAPTADDPADEDAPVDDDEPVDDDAGIAGVEDEQEPDDPAEPDVEPDEPVADDPDTDDAPDVEADTDAYDLAPGDDPTLTDGAPEAADAILQTVPPGLLFFLGGLVVLIGVTVYWYLRASY